MPQSSMPYEEIIAAFETVNERDLWQTRETVYTKPEGGKDYVSGEGAKLPKRGQIVNLDPFSVAFSDFHDRKFGHSYFVKCDSDGKVAELGHVQKLALRIHDEGQLEDCAGVVRKRGDGEYSVQVWRGTGRTLACRLLQLSGVVADAQVRVKIVDAVSSEDPETLKSLVTATVNANLQAAGYSAVDKANIFKQMTAGEYNGVTYTQEEIARVTGVTPASISQLMRITEMIPEIQRLIHEERIGYARALSLKLHKLSAEKQAEFAASLLEKGAAKGKHGGDNGEVKPFTPGATVKALLLWCEDVINSTAHKQASKAIARELKDALASAHGPNTKRLDDVIEENVKGR